MSSLDHHNSAQLSSNSYFASSLGTGSLELSRNSPSYLLDYVQSILSLCSQKESIVHSGIKQVIISQPFQIALLGNIHFFSFILMPESLWKMLQVGFIHLWFCSSLGTFIHAPLTHVHSIIHLLLSFYWCYWRLHFSSKWAPWCTFELVKVNWHDVDRNRLIGIYESQLPNPGLLFP